MPIITDKLIRSLSLPAKANRVYWDDEITGLGIRITASGHKAFVLRYTINGLERRYTIGEFGPSPGFNTTAARARAQEIKGKITGSKNKFDPSEVFDPLEAKERAYKAATVEQLANEYLEKHAFPKKRPDSARIDKSTLEQIVIPHIGNLKVASITGGHIHEMHRALIDTPYRANRVLALLSKMFSLAMQWEWCDSNPVKGIERYHEQKRDRWLSSSEIGRLCEELDKHANERSVNALRLLLLTGARKGEVLTAKWEDIDFERGVWRKPSAHTKQKKTEHVPLSPPALALLTKMHEQRIVGIPHIFPGDAAGKPLQEIRRTWEDVCKKAELAEVRIHDLRHSFASHLVSSGLSLPIVGRLLGHTQTSTTARYAHLADDPLRDATTRFGVMFENAALQRKQEREKVVKLPILVGQE